MRRLALLLVLACACDRPSAGPEHAAEHAEVPGVESALAATARVRDAVAAFGAVAPAGEPPEMADARAAFAAADARRELAARQVRRLEALAGGVAPRKDLDAARAEEAAAAAAAARARQALAPYGFDAPRGPLGVDEAWLIAHVLERDVPSVEAGAGSRFVPDALRAAALSARVDAAPAYVDAATRTAPVRLRVHDPTHALRPGMTGTVTIDVGPLREAVTVPVVAVVYDGAQPVVFVRDGDTGWKARLVRLGIARDGVVEIADGLTVGTRVATTGAASLLSATRLPASEEG